LEGLVPEAKPGSRNLTGRPKSVSTWLEPASTVRVETYFNDRAPVGLVETTYGRYEQTVTVGICQKDGVPVLGSNLLSGIVTLLGPRRPGVVVGGLGVVRRK
jgi:hypothetical protein